MPQPATAAPDFSRSVHGVTSILQSGLTASPHSLSSQQHSCTFSVHVLLTLAQQKQLMWQSGTCDTANALESNCALARSLSLCHADSNKLPNAKLALIQFISFYGLQGTRSDSTRDWSTWEGVPWWQLSLASAWFCHSHLPPAHRTGSDFLTVTLLHHLKLGLLLSH